MQQFIDTFLLTVLNISYCAHEEPFIVVVKHQTELDPFAAFIKNSQTGRVNTSKQGNGDRAETESRVRQGIKAGG